MALITGIKYEEIDTLYQHFCKGKEDISFEDFRSALQDDHLNIKKIKDQINKFCENKKTTLE